MNTFDSLVMLVGVALIVAGVWLFARRKAEGSNHLELLGIKLDVSHPALILVGLGVALLLVPRLLPEAGKAELTPPAVPPTLPSAVPPAAPTPQSAVVALTPPPTPDKGSGSADSPASAVNPTGQYQLLSYLENGVLYASAGTFSVTPWVKPDNNKMGNLSALAAEVRYHWQAQFQVFNAYGQVVPVNYQGEMRRVGDNWYLRVTASNNPAWYNVGEVPLLLTQDSRQLGMRYNYAGADIVIVWQR